MNYDQESDLDAQDLENQNPHEELLNKSRQAKKLFGGCFGGFFILFFIAWFAALGFMFE